MFQILNGRPPLVSGALLGLDIVLKVNEQADPPVALPGLSGGAGASGNAGDNGFFRVIGAQGFEPGEPFLVRRPGGDILSSLDLVPFPLHPGKQIFQAGGHGDQPVDGGFQLCLVAGAVLCGLMLNVALALIPARDDDGQAVFFAQPVAGPAYLVIAALVGMIVLVIGEADRIENQKKILGKYAREHGYNNFKFYVDDGISGTTFNRPGFQQMIADIEAGFVKRVIIKDMSRFGRDYLQVGMYTEIMFPEHDIHFIAVNDGVDSTQGDNEFTPFRNIINEWYAKDTSKKIRAVMKVKGNAGEHLTVLPPYGYIKSPDDKKQWVKDEEAAQVVYEIGLYVMDGFGPS